MLMYFEVHVIYRKGYIFVRGIHSGAWAMLICRKLYLHAVDTYINTVYDSKCNKQE